MEDRMTEGTIFTSPHMIALREQLASDFLGKDIVVIMGDPHVADNMNPFRVIERGTRGDALPGGHYDYDDRFDLDYNRAEDARVEASLAEALRALHQERLDRLDTNYFIPVSLDTTGSMPDGMLREMAEEIRTIVGDFIPMEMAPREIEDRMSVMLMSPAAREARELRITYVRDELPLPKLGYFERNPNHGAPRSIKETMRRNRPSKRRGKRK
jgi:hypothetical protein